MALIKIEPYGIDDIANYTFGGLTITSNAAFGNTNLGNLATANFLTVSGNANLGNAASANYFIGNGSLLTGITTTSLVNGTSNIVVSNNGNATIGIGGTSNVVTITTTGANVNGYVSATQFVGEAGNLSNIQGANVSGTVSAATTAGTVTTAAQPNITSVGLLANLSVNGNSSFIGNANIVGNINQSAGTVNASNLSVTGNVIISGANISLGDVSNLHIAGGNANYVLQTDGTGNLSWTEMTGGSGATTPGDIVVDNFTGDGNTTSFTLSTTPDDIKYVVVNADGVFQLRQSYSVSGNTLTFGSAPADGELIEVSTTIPGTILSGGGSNVDLGNVSSNIIPTANVTYDLGTPTKRWKDLYLSNSTIHLGDTAFSADANGNIILGNITLDSNLGNITSSTFLPFNLTIAPEVLTIQVDATAAGDNINWLWTWQQSTLPYARATITNSQQASVPLYKKGTYTINNFAHTLHGNMTQTHDGFFKWIDGAGEDNLISWAGTGTTATVTHPDINGGTATTVQRYTFTVPENITLPTLNAPNVSYDVSVSNGQYYFGPMAGEGYNVNLGPVYRGGTYTFNLDSSLSGHKIYLTTDNGTGFVNNGYVGEYTAGVTGSRNDGSTGKTTLRFVVPSNAPDVLFYQSATDANMHGAITIRDLAVEQNINGNYVVYFQHEHEGHKTPIELRPIPSMVNQMCLVYDQSVGRFVPQDMATYVENTPSFKNKIREVAGTATLIAPNGVAVVPTVLVVEDVSYLPLVNNKDGDIAFDSYTDTMYVWDTNAWKSTKPTSVATVTSNAQPNITSVGNLTSLSMSGNIIPTANVTYNLGSPTMAWKDLYLSGNSIFVGGQTISASANGFAFSTSVALPANTTVNGNVLTAPLPQSKTYYWKGGLMENVSTMRYYIPTNSTLTAINTNLGTTGLTQSTLVVKKNGSAINTITIPANTASVNQTVSISLAANDYLTVDITQSSSAKDVYVVFIYS